MYELSEADEAFLDRSDGVPHNYTKDMVSVEFGPVDPAFRAMIIAQDTEEG